MVLQKTLKNSETVQFRTKLVSTGFTQIHCCFSFHFERFFLNIRSIVTDICQPVFDPLTVIQNSVQDGKVAHCKTNNQLHGDY